MIDGAAGSRQTDTVQRTQSLCKRQLAILERRNDLVLRRAHASEPDEAVAFSDVASAPLYVHMCDSLFA